MHTGPRTSGASRTQSAKADTPSKRASPHPISRRPESRSHDHPGVAQRGHPAYTPVDNFAQGEPNTVSLWIRESDFANKPGQDMTKQPTPTGQNGRRGELSKVSLLDQGGPLTRAARRGGPRPPLAPCLRHRPQRPPPTRAASPRKRSVVFPEEPRELPDGEHGQQEREARQARTGHRGLLSTHTWPGPAASTALPTCSTRGPRRASPGGHSIKFRAGSKPARVAGQRKAP